MGVHKGPVGDNGFAVHPDMQRCYIQSTHTRAHAPLTCVTESLEHENATCVAASSTGNADTPLNTNTSNNCCTYPLHNEHINPHPPSNLQSIAIKSASLPTSTAPALILSADAPLRVAQRTTCRVK